MRRNLLLVGWHGMLTSLTVLCAMLGVFPIWAMEPTTTSVVAEVRLYGGVPTLWIDGNPNTGCMFWTGRWNSDKDIEDEVAAIGDRSKNIVGRNAYLKKYWAASKAKNAVCFADAWREQHPGKPVPMRMEAYEISEYGRPPIAEDFELLMGD